MQCCLVTMYIGNQMFKIGTIYSKQLREYKNNGAFACYIALIVTLNNCLYDNKNTLLKINN